MAEATERDARGREREGADERDKKERKEKKETAGGQPSRAGGAGGPHSVTSSDDLIHQRSSIFVSGSPKLLFVLLASPGDE